MSTKSCLKCNLNPPLQDHAFCSRTCASSFIRKNCKNNCNQPCFIDTSGKILDFCGDTCRKKFKCICVNIVSSTSSRARNVPLNSSATSVCITCNVKPVYVDPTSTLTSFKFCSKTCASNYSPPAVAVQPTTAFSNSNSPIGLCITCNVKPVYVDPTSTSTIFKFCSKTCATNYSPPAVAVQPTTAFSNSPIIFCMTCKLVLQLFLNFVQRLVLAIILHQL